MCCNQKGLNKGSQKPAVREEESKRAERGSSKQQQSTFKVTVHHLYMTAGVHTLDIVRSNKLIRLLAPCNRKSSVPESIRIWAKGKVTEAGVKGERRRGVGEFLEVVC